MRIKLPPLDPEITFQDQDTFLRKEFAKSLTSIITATTDPLVISLEAQWGDGKTSFVYKWLNQMKAEALEVPHIYIDAYANDYQTDAFMLLASEIYGYVKSMKGGAKAEGFLKAATKASSAVAKGVAKAGINYITAGAFDGEDFTKFEDAVGKELGKLSDSAIESSIKKYTERSTSFKRLQECLTSLAGEIGNGKPLLIVVDELDRCRPSFALEMMEAIKHLFSAENVVFVLVNNPTQMEESVRSRYGAGTDAGAYLRKFYDLTFQLPMASIAGFKERTLSHFIRETFGHYDENKQLDHTYWTDAIIALDKRLGLSLRDIQRLASVFVVNGVYRSVLSGGMVGREITPVLHVGLGAMALKDRELLRQVYEGVARKEDVMAFLKVPSVPSDLQHYDPDDWFDECWRKFTDALYQSKHESLNAYKDVRKHLRDVASGFMHFSVN